MLSVARRVCTRSALGRVPGLPNLPQAVRSASSAANPGTEFDTDLLKLLVDPLCKAPLRYDPVASELMCDEIGVAYPVIAGIPRLLPSAGRVLPKPDAQDTAGPSTGPTVEPWSQ